MRRLLDSLFHLLRTRCNATRCQLGCQWRHLPPPPAFVPWPTVYGYMRAFLRAGVWARARACGRGRVGEHAPPPRAAAARGRGTRTQPHGGHHLGVVVHAASIQDADSAGDLLRRLKPLQAWLRVVFADSVYDRVAALLACFLLGLTLIVVRRIAGTQGFAVQPRRWVVLPRTMLPAWRSSGRLVSCASGWSMVSEREATLFG